MAELFANSAAGGTDETTVTPANSGGTSGTAFAAVSVGTDGEFVFDDAYTPAASLTDFMYRISAGATPAQTYGELTIGGELTFAHRVYMRANANPAGTERLWLHRASGAQASVRMLANGKIGLYDAGNTQRYVSTNSVPLGQVVRIEWLFTSHLTNGHMEARLFFGADPHATTPTETIGNQTDNWNTGPSTGGYDDLRYGFTSNSAGAWSVWMGLLAGDNATWPGPAVTVDTVAPSGSITFATSDRDVTPGTVLGGTVAPSGTVAFEVIPGSSGGGGGGDPTPDPPPFGLSAERPSASYELLLWRRTPQAATAATYAVVGPIVAPTITWSDVLNADGRMDVSCQMDRLDDDVKEALRDIIEVDPLGLELRLHRTVSGVTSTVWAGPLVGGQGQNGTLTLSAAGLSYYLRKMLVTSDLTYTSTDDFVIAKGLVDHGQGQSYGNYGIDTSAVGTSGVLSDRTYLTTDLPDVHQALSRLAATSGFDWWIDPSTRQLMLAATRGSDLSDTIVFDERNIADASFTFDVAAGAFATDAYVVATLDDGRPLFASKANTTARTAFGRAWIATTAHGVSNQDTLADHAQRLVDEHSIPTFVPGSTLVPVEDADVGDFGPGDTVTWSYDAGLGLQTFERRLVSVQTTVDDGGAETITVEFL